MLPLEAKTTSYPKHLNTEATCPQSSVTLIRFPRKGKPVTTQVATRALQHPTSGASV